MWKKQSKNAPPELTDGPKTGPTAFEETLQFFDWARSQGAVHIKAPGGYEAMWLPPEPAMKSEELPEDPQFEEVTLSQWAKMRPPGL